MKKMNETYLLRCDRQNNVIRNERAQEYQREILMEKINQRMGKVDKMLKDKEKLNKERIQVQDNMREKKQNMLDKFAKVRHMDKNFDKKVIDDFIFNNKPLPKGKIKKKEKKK